MERHKKEPRKPSPCIFPRPTPSSLSGRAMCRRFGRSSGLKRLSDWQRSGRESKAYRQNDIRRYIHEIGKSRRRFCFFKATHKTKEMREKYCRCDFYSCYRDSSGVTNSTFAIGRPCVCVVGGGGNSQSGRILNTPTVSPEKTALSRLLFQGEWV